MHGIDFRKIQVFVIISWFPSVRMTGTFIFCFTAFVKVKITGFMFLAIFWTVRAEYLL